MQLCNVDINKIRKEKEVYYDNLPIFKSTLDLVVYIETIVKNFEKYHQYTIGVDLSTHSKEMLFLINRAIYEELKGAMRLVEIKVFCLFKLHLQVTQNMCPTEGTNARGVRKAIT